MRYLIHYGIKGQQWGVKNGPPYPLDQKTHRKVVDKVKEHTRNLGRSIDTKRLMKQAAIAAGAGLAVIGGYALYESGALDDLVKTGKNFVKDIDLGSSIPKQTTVTSAAQHIADKTKVGASPEQLKTELISMIKNINVANKGDSGRNNCYSCCMSYIMNRLFGKNYTALGSDILGNSGAQIDDVLSVFNQESINKIDPFDHLDGGVNGVRFDQKLINLVPNGSTGILRFSDSSGNGHVANYEKTIEGIFSLVENQHGVIFDGESLNKAMTVPGYKFVQAIYDLSKAELAENADTVLKGLVK